MTDLGTLTGDSWAVALAINPAGQIVGWSAPYGGSPVRAFLWEKGVMTNLGTLSGDSESLAWDINSAGQVVGYSYGESGGGHAVLWDRGVMHNLGTIAGGRNSVASGINDRGEVVGFSGTADPEAFHAALWRVR